ncbi:MAG: hypothetical protein V3T86_10755 [Planctomycetota bacterium]
MASETVDQLMRERHAEVLADTDAAAAVAEAHESVSKGVEQRVPSNLADD